MKGFMLATIYSALASRLRRSARTATSDHRDRFDFDEPVGLGERGDGDEGRGRALLPEKFFAHWNQILAMADIGEVRVDLDDARHGAAAGLDMGLDGAEHFPRLRGEVASVGRLALVVVRDLPGQEENVLGTRDLDGL